MNDQDIIKQGLAVFDIEIDELKKVRQRLANSTEFTDAVKEILNCKGKVVVSGMGKSGIIAHKIAATMSSTGTLAVFLHPAEALHGDLGIVAKDDIMLIIAKSGESEEITGMLPTLKIIGTKIISITSNPTSTLAKHSDIVLDAGVDKEACKLNLAPTSSTTVALVMGDALATVLSSAKNFQEKNYALFHPGGRLGKRLVLKVSDFMYPLDDVAIIKYDTVFKNIILSMSEKNHGACLVINETNELAGLITDGDIKRIIKDYSSIENLVASKVMTTSPKTIDIYESAYNALLVMQKEYDITVIPVLDNNKPVGLLRLHDLLKAGL